MKSLLTILFVLILSGTTFACQSTSCTRATVITTRVVYHRPLLRPRRSVCRTRRVVRGVVAAPVRVTGRVLHSICPTCPR